MKQLFNILLISTLLINTANISKDTPNVLTKAEKKGGWILLFDGKTTEGWRGYKGRDMKNWKVEPDGTLHCTNKVNDKSIRCDLITTNEYENFELAWEWKITEASNSGVMFRVNENNPQPYMSGPEYQMIDADKYPERPTVLQESGANYDMHPNPFYNAKNIGEFNQSKIVVNGSHVEHWLNGKKLFEYELWSDDWKKQKGKSKWRDIIDYGNSKKGFLALQDHGSEVWFRNIKLLVLK